MKDAEPKTKPLTKWWRRLWSRRPATRIKASGKRYDRKRGRDVSLNDLDEAGRKKVLAMPDPKPWPSFPEAVKTRQKTGGCGEAAHRAATILHLANMSIRVGRTIHYDPVKEQVIGDDEANRLVNRPMRAPWHL